LGAHYTDRAKIMMIVDPVIIQPWSVEWEKIKATIKALGPKVEGLRKSRSLSRQSDLATATYLRRRYFSRKGSSVSTAETYCPLPFSTADYRRLKKAFRDHAPDVALDRGYTETGAPFLTVGDPGAGFDDAWPIITRNELG
jgi:hypothetical protein